LSPVSTSTYVPFPANKSTTKIVGARDPTLFAHGQT
jgi:hypothetical protein